MKTLRKRVLSALCMVAIGVSPAVAQTNTVQHTVDRGETLASIAKRYATTEAKIIELNPDAQQFVYVGMVLTIPVENVAETVNDRQSVQNVAAGQGAAYMTAKDTSNQVVQGSGEYGAEKWGVFTGFAYGSLPKEGLEGVSSSNFAFSVRMGSVYNFTKSFYAGFGLGYSLAHFSASANPDVGVIMGSTSDAHFIVVPLEVGYRFYLKEDKIALVPYAGLDINYAVHCSVEERVGDDKEKRTVKPKNRLGVNERIGLRVSLWGFDIGGSYVFATDDNFGVDDGYPEVSVSFGF